jgi:hypothetical protein
LLLAVEGVIARARQGVDEVRAKSARSVSALNEFVEARIRALDDLVKLCRAFAVEFGKNGENERYSAAFFTAVRKLNDDALPRSLAFSPIYLLSDDSFFTSVYFPAGGRHGRRIWA